MKVPEGHVLHTAASRYWPIPQVCTPQTRSTEAEHSVVAIWFWPVSHIVQGIQAVLLCGANCAINVPVGHDVQAALRKKVPAPHVRELQTRSEVMLHGAISYSCSVALHTEHGTHCVCEWLDIDIKVAPDAHDTHDPLKTREPAPHVLGVHTVSLVAVQGILSTMFIRSVHRVQALHVDCE